VNQSALESLIVTGMKYSSTCAGDNSSQILFRDSTACMRGSVLGLCHKNDDQTLSRTSGSSIAAKFSSGDNSTCPYSGPPTYSTKLPNSSLRAVRTSSSSSTESASMLLGLSCSAAVGHESTYHQGMESIHLLYALDRGQEQSSTGGELR